MIRLLSICITVCLVITIFNSVSLAGDQNPDLRLLSLLKKKEEAIKQKESELERKKKELLIIQQEIKKEIKKLNDLREAIDADLNEIKNMETARYVDLAKLYASTSPQEAGKIIEQMDVKLAAKIMIHMNKRQAGAIWGFVNPDKACKITKEMVRLK